MGEISDPEGMDRVPDSLSLLHCQLMDSNPEGDQSLFVCCRDCFLFLGYYFHLFFFNLKSQEFIKAVSVRL